MKRGKLLLLGIALSVNVSCEHHTYSCGSFWIFNNTESAITLSTNIESRTDLDDVNGSFLLPCRDYELEPGVWSWVSISELSPVEGERRAYTIGDFIANCEEAYVSATIEIDGEKVTRVWRCSERDDESGRQLFNLADCFFHEEEEGGFKMLHYCFYIYETDFK